MDAEYIAAYPEIYRRHWWWRAREDILVGKIRRLLRDTPEARILDVGCGAALFFDALQAFGHVEGIESNPAAVEQSGRWRSRIVVGELDAAFAPASPFDLILILDVIEHLMDPEALLREAARVLAPRGRILITVPAFNCLWTTHDDLNRHITRYTMAGLTRLVRRAGLVARERGFMFQSLILPKLLVRAKEALATSGTGVPRVPPAAINAAARVWFRAEYAVAGWLPFGSSVFVVAAAAGSSERRGA